MYLIDGVIPANLNYKRSWIFMDGLCVRVNIAAEAIDMSAAFNDTSNMSVMALKSFAAICVAKPFHKSSRSKNTLSTSAKWSSSSKFINNNSIFIISTNKQRDLFYQNNTINLWPVVVARQLFFINYNKKKQQTRFLSM